MELNKNTKLKEIIAAYPEIKGKLPEINPKFAMFNSPMGKIMLSKVTIADMSEKSGIDIDFLMAELKNMIRNYDIK